MLTAIFTDFGRQTFNEMATSKNSLTDESAALSLALFQKILRVAPATRRIFLQIAKQIARCSFNDRVFRDAQIFALAAVVSLDKICFQI